MSNEPALGQVSMQDDRAKAVPTCGAKSSLSNMPPLLGGNGTAHTELEVGRERDSELIFKLATLNFQ